MSRRINEEICVGCGTCYRVCLVGCITKKDSPRTCQINELACVDCGACQNACPKGCISEYAGSE